MRMIGSVKGVYGVEKYFARFDQDFIDYYIEEER